ncbi:hypothetical protein T4A_4722 [Trichinella pseudospiralis]|uniref:Uncharacterized protein n=1 Tax=Trichinella pseudospiralis TaxID=6337 RepID=A0A0V1K1F2_TRIPS|nr:hypothetical protein T4A_4722 [Trichinella pseudospiralis]KRZ41065.1 hypothetical protein T4C_11944 [Trichinella pseudospiralis]
MSNNLFFVFLDYSSDTFVKNFLKMNIVNVDLYALSYHCILNLQIRISREFEKCCKTLRELSEF